MQSKAHSIAHQAVINYNYATEYISFQCHQNDKFEFKRKHLIQGLLDNVAYQMDSIVLTAENEDAIAQRS